MDTESLPAQDDIQPVDSGQTEQDLLDACLLYTSPSPRDS